MMFAAWIAAAAASLGVILQLYLRRSRLSISFPGNAGNDYKSTAVGVRLRNDGDSAIVKVELRASVSGDIVARIAVPEVPPRGQLIEAVVRIPDTHGRIDGRFIPNGPMTVEARWGWRQLRRATVTYE